MPAGRTLRETRQRAVILDELRQTTGHPTADELYRRVRRRLPRVSLGTVYRNLELLAERGTIQKLDSGAGQMRFDGDASSHCHVRCVRCGRVGDTAARPAVYVRDTAGDNSGYEIIGHRVELLGVCPQCQKR